MMLTDDEAVADPVRRITQAADEELEAFEAAISVSDGVVDEDRRLVEQLRDTIQTAMLELVEYAELACGRLTTGMDGHRTPLPSHR